MTTIISNIIGAAIAFVIGALIAFINYKIMQHMMRKSSRSIGVGTLIRQLINIVFLVAVYLIAPLTPCSSAYLLVGAVAGLTLPLFFFTYLLTKENDRMSENKKNGGEN